MDEPQRQGEVSLKLNLHRLPMFQYLNRKLQPKGYTTGGVGMAWKGIWDGKDGRRGGATCVCPFSTNRFRLAICLAN